MLCDVTFSFSMMSMKLSEKEAEVLACIEMRADLPIADVAQETGYQPHTVRYHISSLEDHGIIKRAPFINIVPAGYTNFGIFFSIAVESKDSTPALIEQLMAAKEVTWLAEMGGDYQYGMAVCVKQVYEVQELLSKLSLRFHNLFFDKSVACQFSATAFARGYLSSKRYKSAPLSVADTGTQVVLDELDQKILGSLTRLEYKSNRQLARLMGLPLSTLDARLKKLREKNVLLGYVYEVDSAIFGMQTYTYLIYAKGADRRFGDELYQFAAEHPAVSYLYQCLGSWDFELNVEISDGKEIAELTRQIQNRFGAHINTIKVLPKFRELKYSLVPF
jgi:DNA-binding Lrp family transcriptional regulator